MHRFVRVVLLSAAVVLAGCGAGPDPAADGTAGTAEPSSVPGFDDPELAGLCEVADVTIAADEPAAPDHATAIEEFVRSNAILADTSIQGTEITYDGEVVGHVRISGGPAGGYYVETAEWCHPE